VQITIDLTDEQAERLRQMAESLGVDPNQLARAAFADWFARPQQDFQSAAAHVLEKNRELYDRLSQ
jgi:predicted transcriptional regulator